MIFLTKSNTKIKIELRLSFIGYFYYVWVKVFSNGNKCFSPCSHSHDFNYKVDFDRVVWFHYDGDVKQSEFYGKEFALFDDGNRQLNSLKAVLMARPER